jgi:hypothetical protein
MKRAIARAVLPAFIFIAFAMAAETGRSATPELTIQEIVKKAAPSIVTIEVFDRAGDNVGEGTGFFVGPGLVLTNAHVVEDAYSLSITCIAPKKRTDTQPRILKLDPESDLALLETKRIDGPPLSFDIAIPIEPGQRVVAYGNLHEDNRLVSEGIVRACLPDEIVYSAPTHPGHSGSPLLDMQGRVIGICTGSSVRAGIAGMGFAVNILTIAKFVSSRDAPVDFPIAGTSLFWPRIWVAVSSFFERLFTPVFEFGEKLFSLYLKIATVLVLGLLCWKIVRSVPKPVKAYLAFAVSVVSLIVAILLGLLVILCLFNREAAADLIIITIIMVLSCSVCYFARKYYRRHRPGKIAGLSPSLHPKFPFVKKRQSGLPNS